MILQPFLKYINKAWLGVEVLQKALKTMPDLIFRATPKAKKKFTWFLLFYSFREEGGHLNAGHFETQSHVKFKGRWL